MKRKAYVLITLFLLITSIFPFEIAASNNFNNDKKQSQKKTININGLNFEEGFRRGINFCGVRITNDEAQWLDVSLIKDEHLKIVKDMGFDYIRLCVEWTIHIDEETYTIEPSYFELVDHVIAEGLKNDLGVIIDVHNFWQFNNDPLTYKNLLFSIWQQLSVHYVNLPLTVAFDILNEPQDTMTFEQWNEYQNECIRIIRRTNPNRKIVVSPIHLADEETILKLVLPKDLNLIATFHTYTPSEFTHQGTGDKMMDLGTKWLGTKQERKDMEQCFSIIRSWSESTGIPILLGEFGTVQYADMESRVRWTTAMREFSESYGFSWCLFDFGSVFGLYDTINHKKYQPMLDALFPATKTTNYGTKLGNPKVIVSETEKFIGPARLDTPVYILYNNEMGISVNYTNKATPILTLNGSKKVRDWAPIIVSLPDIKDTGKGFSKNIVEITFKNINQSITDFNIDLATNDGKVGERILWPTTYELINGNGENIIKNGNGTTTYKIDISKVYDTFKGNCESGIILSLIIETAPENQERYDREGSIEIISCKAVKR